MRMLAPSPRRVVPQVLGRLSEFDGTCVTLLVRGLGLPPPATEEAFSRLPSDRFAVKQFPPYNPAFGFVADRLMLSWAVRSAEATAFVSTLHTQPLWVSVVCQYRVVSRFRHMFRSYQGFAISDLQLHSTRLPSFFFPYGTERLRALRTAPFETGSETWART